MNEPKKKDAWTLYDLRELPRGRYFTQCQACLWKGQQIGGSPDSVCPACGEPLYALSSPSIVISEIHRAGNETTLDILKYSMNPYTSPHKIMKGFEMAAIEEIDPMRGDTSETLQKKVADARKDAIKEIKRRF